MITIQQEDSIEVLQILKAGYLQQTTAPLDGMWLVGFVPMAKHYGFYADSELIGYCCVNDEGFVLQFYLAAGHETEASELFTSIVTNQNDTVGEIHGAITSTAEPLMLSYCADAFAKISVNALMYIFPEVTTTSNPSDNNIALSLISENELEKAVDFAHEAIGAPKEWLAGYYGNLIQREELFGHWDNETLAATGECRLFDGYQSEYADLGVIVSAAHRGKGIATKVIKQLIAYARAKELRPICSTEKGNAGAQKAISRAGFIAHHRIIEFREPAGA